MSHALIINDNMVIAHAIRCSLLQLGFTSFDQAWAEGQAMSAADRHLPDLVVIGDDIEAGSSIGAAKKIAGKLQVPILLVTGNPDRAKKFLAQASSFEGPFLLNQIDEAVALARSGASTLLDA